VGPGPAVPVPPPIAPGYREPPRVWSDRRCLRLADGRVAMASISSGYDVVYLEPQWTSAEPVTDFLCRQDDIVLLLRDGRVVRHYFDAHRVLGPEKPYDDYPGATGGFVAKGGTRLAEVNGKGWAWACVTGGSPEVRCPQDVKEIYGDLEALGPIRTLYAQGRAALLEDGRFVLGGPGVHNYPGTNPVQLDRVVRAEIADLGFNHIVGCLVRDDASVWCWGPNEFGQLGDGTRERHDKPVRVIGLPRVVDVSTSGQHACAIDEEGGVWCWGRSEQGETGRAGRKATDEVEICPVDEVATEEARKWAETHPPCTRPTTPVPDDPCGRLGWTPESARKSVDPKYKRVPGCVMPNESHPGNAVPVRIDEVEGAVALEALPGRTWAVRRDGVIVMWGMDGKLSGGPRMVPFPVVKKEGAAGPPR